MDESLKDALKTPSHGNFSLRVGGNGGVSPLSVKFLTTPLSVKINSQSLEDTQVGHILQKYTLDKYTLEKYTLKKYTLEWVADQLTGGEGPPRKKFENKWTKFFEFF